MPGNDAAVVRRLAKKLVMPEPDVAPKQLSCSHNEGGTPQDVVERFLDPPRAKCVKQGVARIGRLIGVELIKQLTTRMVRLREPFERSP